MMLLSVTGMAKAITIVLRAGNKRMLTAERESVLKKTL